MEPYFLDWLQQFDLSALGDLSELDWGDIATYGTLAIAVGGGVWASSKSFVQFVWSKIEPVLGFAISTLVVFSLWYSLLRVHVSVSFNLDKELFDNLLWLSAVLFTPYYLVRYNLVVGAFMTLARTAELLIDLLIFSWFPQQAERNRQKWRTRVTRVYSAIKQSLTELWQAGVSSAKDTKLPFGLDKPQNTPATPAEEDSSDGLEVGEQQGA